MGYSINNVESFKGFEVDNGMVVDYEGFNDYLDSYQTVMVAGCEFLPSRILSELDPVAYSCFYNDYIGSVQSELESALLDEDYSQIEWINEPEGLE